MQGGGERNAEDLTWREGSVTERLIHALVNGIGNCIIGRHGIRYTGDIFEKLEMGRFESPEFRDTRNVRIEICRAAHFELTGRCN